MTLPNGEVIEIDVLPYDGWGTQPGKSYTFIERDREGNELWQRRWFIPAQSPLLHQASADIRR